MVDIPKKLLTTSNPKTMKGQKKGYETYILHLAPSNLSGTNTCPSSSKGCATACLNEAGMGCFDSVQNARITRTKYFFEKRDAFMQMLDKEIKSAITSAKKKGLVPAFRLNGTSDIRWEEVTYGDEDKTVFDYFPQIQFYDYTKIPNRGRKKGLPDNYTIVFSRSEENDRFVNQAMRKGQNVAVVFGDPPGLPDVWRGWNVLDGDETDLRFLDPPQRIVGLTAKGTKGKNDTTGFVVYGEGMIDIDSLKKRSKKDFKSARGDRTIGPRKIDNESFIPVQSKVSKKMAERTANLIRGTGRKARVVTHKPKIGGKAVEAFAVYVPGVYKRSRSGAIHGLRIREPNRANYLRQRMLTVSRQ